MLSGVMLLSYVIINAIINTYTLTHHCMHRCPLCWRLSSCSSKNSSGIIRMQFQEIKVNFLVFLKVTQLKWNSAVSISFLASSHFRLSKSPGAHFEVSPTEWHICRFIAGTWSHLFSNSTFVSEDFFKGRGALNFHCVFHAVCINLFWEGT